MGWIVWTKNRGNFSCSDAELAFSSFNRALREFRKNPIVMTREGEMIHPTQKPICLYNWILENYAKPDFKILDTHLGSGSHAIACHYYGCELVASELDSEYYDASLKRFKQQTAQIKLF
jgi:site-specific DNA-methyltransferase (adenine-specific)